MKDIEKLRQQIDELDDRIIKLLAIRFHLTDQIGAIKRQTEMAVTDSNRERLIYDKIDDESIAAVYRSLIAESKRRQGKD